MIAPVLQWQIITAHADEAVAFYADFFGWKVSTANALGYRQIQTGTGGMSGGVWPSPPGNPSVVQLFVGVPQLETALGRAVELGANVVVPATVLPDGDKIAVVTDPFGISFGLIEQHR